MKKVWSSSAVNLNIAQTPRAGVHERHHRDRPGVAGGPGPALLREDDPQVSLKLSHYHLLSINYRSITRKRVNTNAGGNEVVKAAHLGAIVMHSLMEVLN